MSTKSVYADPLPAEVFGVLQQTDTPTVSNAVEKAGVRALTDGFCDSSVRCLFPEFGILCGYAVTAEAETMTEKPGDFRQGMAELVRVLADALKPAVVVMQEATPHPERSAHCGEMMASIFQRMGVVGLVSDACVRDVVEVRALRFHYFARGVVASHGGFRITRVNVPVRVGGLEIRPGDLLHGDANGLIKVPREGADTLPALVDQVRARETALMSSVRGSEFHLDDLIQVLTH